MSPSPRPARPAALPVFAGLLAALAAPSAQASFLQGEALDTMANVISWVVLLVLPVGFLAVFWMVHVLPEKIAEKRQHPNKEAIHVLCLLSLVFGGLLWPLAWLWTYARPAGYKLAYGTEKHEDYFVAEGERATRGELAAEHVAQLREELEVLQARGQLSPELKGVLAGLKARADGAVIPGAEAA